MRWVIYDILELMNLEVLAEVKESMKLPMTSGSDLIVFFWMPILLSS